jgi:hypothetical protein
MTLLHCRAIRLPNGWLTQSGFLVQRVEGSVGADDSRLNTTGEASTPTPQHSFHRRYSTVWTGILTPNAMNVISDARN